MQVDNMDQKIFKIMEDMVNKKIELVKKDMSNFRKWRKFDSVTDQFSPITGASQQIGFFGTNKVAQPTTSSASASFTANSGTAVNSASTFDGYTLAQVVKALRTLGLLQ